LFRLASLGFPSSLKPRLNFTMRLSPDCPSLRAVVGFSISAHVERKVQNLMEVSEKGAVLPGKFPSFLRIVVVSFGSYSVSRPLLVFFSFRWCGDAIVVLSA
jgi:hypothetical protein